MNNFLKASPTYCLLLEHLILLKYHHHRRRHYHQDSRIRSVRILFFEGHANIFYVIVNHFNFSIIFMGHV